MFHRVFRSLAVLLACVALCGAYHRHSYPIVMFNGCAAFPWSPLGVDGSVLLRSYVEPGPALRLFCRAHDLNKSTCEHVKESVVAEMKLHEQEELNWIGVWDQGRVQVRVVQGIPFKLCMHEWFVM